jgi:hypothetical protein
MPCLAACAAPAQGPSAAPTSLRRASWCHHRRVPVSGKSSAVPVRHGRRWNRQGISCRAWRGTCRAGHAAGPRRLPDLADLSLADLNLADPDLADPDLADPDLADLNLADLNLADLNLADLNLADLNLADLNLADLTVPHRAG